MSDSRSFRDAFGRRTPPARDGLGRPIDKFRQKAGGSGGDAFKATGKPALKGPEKRIVDAFAPKAKPVKALAGPAALAGPKPALTKPSQPLAKLGLPKPPKPPKPPKMTVAKPSPLMPPRQAQVKPQKMTAPLPPKPTLERKALNKPANMFAETAPVKDAFGRTGAKPKPPKALVPAPPVKHTSPITKPAAKLRPPVPPVVTPPVAPKAEASKVEAPKVETPELAPPEAKAPEAATPDIATPEASAPDAAAPDVAAEASKASLQVIANESVLDHTEFRKFRRAARSSSLVLVSGAAADAIASTDTVVTQPDVEGVTTVVMAADEPDTLAADKPDQPPTSPASPAPAPAAEKPAAPTASTEAPAAPSATVSADPKGPVDPPAEPLADPAPAAKRAAPVEIVEPTVEPQQSPPFDTASVPEDALTGAKRKAASGTSTPIETSWQEVAGAEASEAQPTVAVLRKMETSPVGGYWGGAATSARAATSKRGFNQDDMFGLVFGLAVIAFMLLWLFRGRGAEPPAEDQILTAQSAPTAASVNPAPPPASVQRDPFGDAPVDLRPSGPVPEAPPQAAVAPPAVTPQATTPPTSAPSVSVPPVTAAPTPAPAVGAQAAAPLDATKMHAWFCTASSRLTKSSRTQLTGELAKYEDVFAGKELVVRGYADTRGSTELNADLGSRRAQTVADYLTKKGLSVVDVQGVGELAGLDDNQNCSNQRRVDVWVKGGPAETPSRACVPEQEAEALICG